MLRPKRPIDFDPRTGVTPSPVAPAGPGPVPPQAPASQMRRSGTFSDFLSGAGGSPFGGSDMTDGLTRNWKLMRQKLNPPQSFQDVGQPARKDYQSSPFVF